MIILMKDEIVDLISGEYSERYIEQNKSIQVDYYGEPLLYDDANIE